MSLAELRYAGILASTIGPRISAFGKIGSVKIVALTTGNRNVQKIEVLVLEEDDMVGDHVKTVAGSDRVLWLADYAVLRRKDGTVKVLKDRYSYPRNKSRFELCLS